MSKAVMQQALEALVEINKLSIGEHAICLPGEIDTAMDALRAALAEPRPIQECYGDCPTNPQTCPNPCNFEGRPKPEKNPFGGDAERYARKLREWREYYKTIFTEHKLQTTHWEGCEAVHPECKEKNT